MTIQETLLTWEQLLAIAQSQTPLRRVRRPGQSPSTAPIPGSWHKLAPGEKPVVLLYRDTNSWCPFCERVWFALEEKGIPFETEFIDLSNKPQWYLDLVPTALVPAVKIDGHLVYESKDILFALEERFGPTLLPQDAGEATIAQEWIAASETSGFLATSYGFLRDDGSNPDATRELKVQLEGHLDELEHHLGKYPGPYFLSQFSLVDILYSPHLDRLADNLPVYQGYAIRGNSRFPRINAWFEALSQRPAYQHVRSESVTNNLLLHRRWGRTPIGPLSPLDPAISQQPEYRAEAAERLSDNHEAAIGDILKNSGLQALIAAGNRETVRAAVDWHLRLLATFLLQEDLTRLPWGRVGGQDNADPLVAAVGAITLAYLRNRICAPRDMSAGAATALRAAVDRVLTSIY